MLLSISSRSFRRPRDSSCLTFASVIPVASAISALSRPPKLLSLTTLLCPGGSESIRTSILCRVSRYSVEALSSGALNSATSSSVTAGFRRRIIVMHSLRRVEREYILNAPSSSGISTRCRHSLICVSCTTSAASSGGIPIFSAKPYINR